jgi:hypothetical protein
MKESISIKSMSLKPDISLCQQYAANKGGKLNSVIYINARTPLEWQCKVKTAQQRDKNKEQYCEENNITLIVIPYSETNIEYWISTNV